jgi:hypothetical protein
MFFMLEVGGTPGSRIGHLGHTVVLIVIGLGRTGSVITRSQIKIARARQARGYPLRLSKTADGACNALTCFS